MIGRTVIFLIVVQKKKGLQFHENQKNLTNHHGSENVTKYVFALFQS